MPTMILDRELEQQLRAERSARGADRYDEVWEGIYMKAPAPNDEHQELVMELGAILPEVIGRIRSRKSLSTTVSRRTSMPRENWCD